MPMVYDNVTLQAIQGRHEKKVAEMGSLMAAEKQLKLELLRLKEKYLEIKEERKRNWEVAIAVLAEINELQSIEELCILRGKDKAAMEELFKK